MYFHAALVVTQLFHTTDSDGPGRKNVDIVDNVESMYGRKGNTANHVIAFYNLQEQIFGWVRMAFHKVGA